MNRQRSHREEERETKKEEKSGCINCEDEWDSPNDCFEIDKTLERESGVLEREEEES